MTQVIGSHASLVDGIRIDDNIPLPPKQSKAEIQKQLELQSQQKQQSILTTVSSEPIQSRLTMKHIRWRVSVARYQRNERIL